MTSTVAALIAYLAALAAVGVCVFHGDVPASTLTLVAGAALTLPWQSKSEPPKGA